MLVDLVVRLVSNESTYFLLRTLFAEISRLAVMIELICYGLITLYQVLIMMLWCFVKLNAVTVGICFENLLIFLFFIFFFLNGISCTG